MLRTKAQQKKICSECSLAKTADLIGDSVVLLIIRDLLRHPARFSDLSISLLGISTRTLTKKLKDLECKGLIKKAISEQDSRSFIYSLTDAGKGLGDIAQAMRTYGDTFLK